MGLYAGIGDVVKQLVLSLLCIQQLRYNNFKPHPHCFAFFFFFSILAHSPSYLLLIISGTKAKTIAHFFT